MLTSGCECGFFSGCPPSSNDLINAYFIEAATTPDCQIEYSWAGGRDGWRVFGVLSCPDNVRNEIIQSAQPSDGCLIDTDYEEDLQNSNCSLYNFKDLFESSVHYRSDRPQWLPSTYQGVWTIYNVGVEAPKDSPRFHSCTLYYHENSKKLYFLAANDRYPNH
jgi:hypothetical protein